MARNRIIYQSQALYVGEKSNTSDDTRNKEIHRVQDVSFNVDVPRVDINEFGQLSQLSREITEPPTVSLDFSYYLTNGTNEDRLGFAVNGVSASPKDDTTLVSAIADIIATAQGKDEFNYYVLTKPEGEDAHGGGKVGDNVAGDGVIAIGNGFVTSYSIEAAVGDYPTASVSVEAANLAFGDHGTVENPAIDEATGNKVDATKVNLPNSTNALSGALAGLTALRSGDVSVEFFADATTAAANLKAGGAVLPGSVGASSGQSVHIQNFSVECPLARTPLNKIGNFFPFSREIDFPITGTFSITANLADLQAGSIYDMICGEDKKNAIISFKDKCGTSLGDGGTMFEILIKGATLDSQNFGHSLGDMQTVDLTFSVPLGANKSSGDGIFFSGDAAVHSGPITIHASASASVVTAGTTYVPTGEGAMLGSLVMADTGETNATYQGGTIAQLLAPNGDGNGATVVLTETAGKATAAAIVSPGTGYKVGDKIQILGGLKADGTGSVAHDIKITDGGANTGVYQLNDILTLTLAGATNCALKVTGIDSNDGITSVAINGVTHGLGWNTGDVPTSHTNSTGGAVDATFEVLTVFGGAAITAPTADASFALQNITGNGSGARCVIDNAAVGVIDITDGGTGYKIDDTFTVSGGDGKFVGKVVDIDGD
jgi:hypothetical protein